MVIKVFMAIDGDGLHLYRLIFQTSFEELNPETLSNQVMKYAKTVMQLEKGLPPNSVVPILKEKVEGMRHKVLECYGLTDVCNLIHLLPP